MSKTISVFVTPMRVMVILAILGIAVSGFTNSVFVYGSFNYPQDDKNNPTFPGCGIGSRCHSTEAMDNHGDNCTKHIIDFESPRLPAQCQ